MKKIIYLFLLCCIILTRCDETQNVQPAFVPPAPVTIDIQNILQEQTDWCWAASAQQVIQWLTNGNSPPQCQLVASAFGANPNYCCSFPEQCNTPGNLQQIQSLIQYYGGHATSASSPGSAMDLYNILKQHHAVVLFLQTTPYVGHYVVLRGMEWRNDNGTYNPIVYINDPLQYYIQPIYFSNLQQIWAAAIIVY